MNIEPIPNSLLGDDIILQKPEENGRTDYSVTNVRVERSYSIESFQSGAKRNSSELTVWFDCENSFSPIDIAVGMSIKYGGEIFDIVKIDVLRGTSPHHLKISAVGTGNKV